MVVEISLSPVVVRTFENEERFGTLSEFPFSLLRGKLPPRLFRETHYEPIAGRCIMFPSWLMHCVDPNESNDIRISVSFNFLQKGMFV